MAVLVYYNEPLTQDYMNFLNRMKNKYIGLQWTQDIQALASFCGMISLEQMDFNSSPKIRQM